MTIHTIEVGKEEKVERVDVQDVMLEITEPLEGDEVLVVRGYVGEQTVEVHLTLAEALLLQHPRVERRTI